MPSAMVPLKEIETEHKLWKNPRSTTGLGDKEIEELSVDIKTAGKIIDPPKCVQVKTVNGHVIWLAVDGQRRVIAGGRVLPKNTEIEVVDVYGEPVDLTPEICDELTSMAISMFNRSPLSSFELSETAERMRAAGRELAKIAVTIHRSESWVSKMLKARSTASPKLLRAWSIGELTDEQFKDLAAQKDVERQAAETKEVVETRKSGDKTEARIKAKEVAEGVKAKETKKAKADAERDNLKALAKSHKEDAKGAKAGAKTEGANYQGDFSSEAWNPPGEAKPKKPTKPSPAAIEELISMAGKRPPTHDFVKGVLSGVLYSQGMLDLESMPKPWAAWVSRVGGSVSKKSAKAPKASAPKAKKAKAPKAKKIARHAERIAASSKKPTKKAKASAKKAKSKKK